MRSHKSILSICLLLCLIAFTNLTIAQTTADQLIKSKQFQKAWETLKNTSENEIDNTVAKVDLCLKYFVKTYQHELFAFINLKPNQSLIESRRKAEVEMVPMEKFNIELVLDSMIKRFPNEAKLYIAQGDFYYEIQVVYGKDWLKSKEEVIRRMLNAYSKAHELGLETSNSNFALATFWNLNDDVEKAFNYFKKSVELDSTNASAYYYLAYLSIEKGDYQSALDYSQDASDYYEVLDYKTDATRMTGMILSRLNRNSDAIEVLLEADRLIPSSYPTFYYLLPCYVAENKILEAQLVAKNMFYVDWKSHTIHNDIIDGFLKYNQLPALIDFYNQRLLEDKYDKEFQGFIHLHMAQAYERVNDLENKKLQVAEAKACFSICYDANHPIFSALLKMEE